MAYSALTAINLVVIFNMAMHVTLRQLQVFLALAANHSFSQTGQTLGLTQSAVSRSMAELEGQLGVRLLDRYVRDHHEAAR